MLRKVVRGVVGSAAVCASIAMAGAGGCGGSLTSVGPGDGGSVTTPGSTPNPGAGQTVHPGEAGAGTSATDGGATKKPPTVVNKVDLLFDIDNSASMGDKQAYLSQAIPDLVARLVTPNCVDSTGKVTGQATLGGACADPSSNAEFAPVHNLHLGIVSSSLGARLGDSCPSTGMNSMQPLAGGALLDRHNDDQAHLLDRSADPMMLTNYTETPLGTADPTHFLDWFPPSSVSPNNAGINPAPPPASGPPPVTTPAALQSDFQQLVVGVHQFGCGIESQLETWYRFLIQPDPYGALKTTMANGTAIAQWDGVDTTILQQRADFLRPDSLVAILVLTDENDSEVDVRSFSGTAWNFMSRSFNPPRGTSICLTDPNNSACTSCAFGGNSTDSECAKGFHTDKHDWGNDLNLRHVHEKQKYGVSVQFPIQRYLLGLTSPKVPNRDGEYPPDGKGAYASSYQGLSPGNLNCTNPLYAKTLPRAPNGDVGNWKPQWTSGNPPSDANNDLCNLAAGGRKPSLIYYAHIGGVPHELLQIDSTKMDVVSQSQKATLTDADWKLILGNNPDKFDYSGIDPHMVESYQDRSSAAVPPNGHKVADPTQPEGTDPISGREWVTDSTMAEHQGLVVDREYACIFKLQTARHCDDASTKADPTLQDSCDCQPPSGGTGAFTHQQVPAVCNDADPTLQDYAKVYPTTRELLLARLLGQVPGANEGVISSMCPIHTVEQGAGDPLFGYRPAINALVGRLKKSL